MIHWPGNEYSAAEENDSGPEYNSFSKVFPPILKSINGWLFLKINFGLSVVAAYFGNKIDCCVDLTIIFIS